MAPNKRKGVDVSSDGMDYGPAFVVVENQDVADGESLKRELQDLRQEHSEDDDPILFALENACANDGSAEQLLTDEISTIKSELDEKIRQAKDAYNQESNVLQDLRNQMDRMYEKRKNLHEGMQDLEQKQVDLQKKIALHQEEASEEIDQIDKVEEERKRQVPRLKTQMSLFASTTGIKWDFAQEDILSGSVVSY